MHKNTTVTLLTMCTLLASNWGLASIDARSSSAAPRHGDVLSPLFSSHVQDPPPGTAVLLLAQVGDLLRDTIRRQIRQRLETGEFDDRDLGNDDGDQGGDDVANNNASGDNENDNSSPDDGSQDNGDASLDNSDDTSEDSDDEPSNDDDDEDSDNGGRGNAGMGRGRGPRGSFDSQF